VSASKYPEFDFVSEVHDFKGLAIEETFESIGFLKEMTTTTLEQIKSVATVLAI
jgi:hypothetical protein